mgnify:CR=1 FL=1
MPISVVYTVSDAKGDQSTFTIPIPDATSPADMVEFAQDMAELLEPLINGTLRDVHILLPVTFIPWAVPAAISDIQEKARFVFRTVNGFVKSLSLPAVIENIFSTNTRQVDLTNTDVSAFVAGMVDGLTLSSTETVEPVDVRGEDLTELEAAIEAWGKSRR